MLIQVLNYLFAFTSGISMGMLVRDVMTERFLRAAANADVDLVSRDGREVYGVARMDDDDDETYQWN